MSAVARDIEVETMIDRTVAPPPADAFAPVCGAVREVTARPITRTDSAATAAAVSTAGRLVEPRLARVAGATDCVVDVGGSFGINGSFAVEASRGGVLATGIKLARGPPWIASLGTCGSLLVRSGSSCSSCSPCSMACV